MAISARDLEVGLGHFRGIVCLSCRGGRKACGIGGRQGVLRWRGVYGREGDGVGRFKVSNSSKEDAFELCEMRGILGRAVRLLQLKEGETERFNRVGYRPQRHSTVWMQFSSEKKSPRRRSVPPSSLACDCYTIPPRLLFVAADASGDWRESSTRSRCGGVPVPRDHRYGRPAGLE